MPMCCCAIGCQHSTCCLVVISWYYVITWKRQTNHRCALSNAFFYNFLIFWCSL